MDRLAFEQAHSTKSAVMTQEKFRSIVHFLKNTEGEGGGQRQGEEEEEEGGARPLDGHARSWVRSRGFCLTSVPEEGVRDVLVVPFREKGQSVPKMLQVLHFGLLFDVVRDVHQGHFQHGGYKRVLNYLQDRYYGVTRGYVQEFCSMCPVCRPHKRRLVGVTDVPLDAFNHILKQSMHQQQQHHHQQQQQQQRQHHQQHQQGRQYIPMPPRQRRLQPRQVPSEAVEVIAVDDSSDSEDRSLPGGSSPVPATPLRVQGHDHQVTSRVRNQRDLTDPDDGGGDVETLSPEWDGSSRGDGERDENCDLACVNTPQTGSSSRAHPYRVQSNRTRTVVKGDNVYIVTVNKDSETEEEDPLGKEDDEADTSQVSVTSIKQEPDDDYSVSSHNYVSGERVGFWNERRQQRAETSTVTSPSHYKSTANIVNTQRFLKPITISKHSEHDTERPLYLPKDTATNIKTERVDEIFTTEDPTLSGEESIPDYNDDFVEFRQGQYQYVDSSSNTARFKHVQICRQRVGDEEVVEGIVVKVEPPDEAGVCEQTVLKPSKDTTFQAASRESSAGSTGGKHSSPPVKKIKKEIHTDSSCSSSSHSQPSSSSISSSTIISNNSNNTTTTIPPPSPFFQHLHVDVIDMTHLPHDDFRFICHVTDPASKLHVLFPLRQAALAEVASGLDRHVLVYYGLPQYLHSRRGYWFVQELIGAVSGVVEGGLVCCNGELLAAEPDLEGRGGGGVVATNVVEELIAMLRVERCSNSRGAVAGTETDQRAVPWVSWLPRIMRSLNRDWFSALRRSAAGSAVASGGGGRPRASFL